MHGKLLSLAALACALASLGAAAPAHAQQGVTFVSHSGNDGNDCFSPAAPCRQVSTAITKTIEHGTVHVLAGEYGPFIVTKSINIIADSGQASVVNQAAGSPEFPDAAVVVLTAATKVVRIRGFLLNNFANGVSYKGSGVLYLEECTLVGGTTDDNGVFFEAQGVGELYITDSIVSAAAGATAGAGIRIRPTGSGSAKVVLDNVRVENNHVGILLDCAGSTGGITMSVADSTVSGNSTMGIGVFEGVTGGTPTGVAVEGTTISQNGGQGIVASRSSATVRVRHSTITGNGVGAQSLNGGQIVSHGDNVLAGNTTNGAFTSTLPPQ